MKRKPKTVTWVVERLDSSYRVAEKQIWVSKQAWKTLRLPVLRPGQKAKFKVTVEVLE